ncbi:sigma-54-dependent transcriptional regulator [Kosmotoga olearia]|uniref:Two component, sigma54 specific, transcriptional regulator, Fis family n=1 Tax=Kosmotoga olearia (strain ATCC BAA-1733 / DSM 21960 / TBF 19.5.1) TaxID=521045 RepID=C5CF13_KOSOT|nr:sigma-54 dependent transcriptional regulator [Kosmotoga olearia]ACR80282.1 two component, sigma54 specific, transcriptional regulator, Fis family [Kosmotoga olearia TBF 19.5.1]
MKRKLLVVDDDMAFNLILCEALESEGYLVTKAHDLKSAKELLQEESFDCALLDIRLPDGDGIELIDFARSQETIVIVMSAHGNIETAVSAVKKGAYNFLEKPFDLNHALVEVERALKFAELQREHRLLLKKVKQLGFTDELLGVSESIVSIKKLIENIAPKKVTVLIQGESGTGKEVIARMIHKLSGRKEFVDINCGAIPENLFESEIFGYEKGAFTGAGDSKKGLVEEADRGTLFLDEISELPITLQPKLLRFIETGTFQRIGSTKRKKTDVRIICATNRDLEKLVEEGKFREDLFYRLNVVRIKLPPLRERPEDIAILAKQFVKDISAELGLRKRPKISETFIQALMNYHWPGNVRELRNCLLSILAVHDSSETLEEWMLFDVLGSRIDNSRDASNEDLTLEELEKRYIRKLLKKYSGNKTKVAQVLGISKSTLYEKLKRWEPF